MPLGCTGISQGPPPASITKTHLHKSLACECWGQLPRGVTAARQLPALEGEERFIPRFACQLAISAACMTTIPLRQPSPCNLLCGLAATCYAMSAPACVIEGRLTCPTVAPRKCLSGNWNTRPTSAMRCREPRCCSIGSCCGAGPQPAQRQSISLASFMKRARDTRGNLC